MRKMLTITETAKEPDCPVSAGTLRRLVKTGKCPGFYSGNRFFVDLDGLIAWIKQQNSAEVAG